MIRAMNPWHASLLGIVQGLTEYLPVSSSAHLVIVQAVLHLNDTLQQQEIFLFDVLVQLGSVVGLVAYFARECFHHSPTHLVQANQKGIGVLRWVLLGVWLATASLPAAVVGLLYKSRIESLFTSSKMACALLIVTALLLWLAEWRATAQAAAQKVFLSHVPLWAALCMGLAQVLALLPGVSRSGCTIAAGMLVGLGRPTAARFSFLMAIVALTGASFVCLPQLFADRLLLQRMAWPLLVGFSTAALTGYVVVFWFLRFVRRNSLRPFALYCLLLALVGLLFFP
ncbi:MAG: undecaprenyl-diphosphate phosphatase [Myxococcota bacterium]